MQHFCRADLLAYSSIFVFWKSYRMPFFSPAVLKGGFLVIEFLAGKLPSPSTLDIP